MEKIRVIIADDFKECAVYYSNMVNKSENIEVIAIAGSAAEAIELAEKLHPDIMLIDVQMEQSDSGITATKVITENFPDIRIIILTAFYDEDIIVEAYLAGAVDYYIKELGDSSLIDTINNVYSNTNFIGKTISMALKKNILTHKSINNSFLYMINYISSLSKRETEILKMLLDNSSRQEIRENLHIEESTLKTHINKILKKLEYPNIKAMVKSLKLLKIDILLKKG